MLHVYISVISVSPVDKQMESFVKHKHPLILDENFRGGQKDACYLCKEPLHSPLIHSVYRCSSRSNSSGIGDEDVDCVNLFLHKSCAELPSTITDYFKHPQHPISLTHIRSSNSNPWSCSICFRDSSTMRVCYSCRSPTCSDLIVCLKCVTSPRVHHPSHSQHELTIIHESANFLCHICDRGWRESMLSCKCNICPFWIHMKCALLPLTFEFEFHRHPLIMASSVPQLYSKFPQHCQHCSKSMDSTEWLYYCGSCRFFIHIPCSILFHGRTKTSRDEMRMMRDKNFDIWNVDTLFDHNFGHGSVLILPEIFKRIGLSYIHPVRMPVPDEIMLKFWQQRFIEQMSYENFQKANEKPNEEVIKHQSHDRHLLNLRNHHPEILINKSSTSTTDMKFSRIWRCIVENDKILSCDGCKYPIYSSTSQYYECHQCKFYLHADCAVLTKCMQFHGHGDNNIYISSSRISLNYLFKCGGCGFLKSGIPMISNDGRFPLDIGCASLPKHIEHQAHKHDLYRHCHDTSGNCCIACGKSFENTLITFSCIQPQCQTFHLHSKCALKPHKLKHRWDPHPLTLITKPEIMTEDHPHDYNCEHCSEDIDTSYWFYHCSLCDLSCHLTCIDEFNKYSYIEFGVSNIETDEQLHEHGLTLVLNRRKRCCGCCGCQIYEAPVLECTPCNFISCMSCANPDHSMKVSGLCEKPLPWFLTRTPIRDS